MFQDNENLVSAVLAPETIIGEACFSGCSSLVRVSTMAENLPIEHLNTVAASSDAFTGCTLLRHLDGKVQLHVDDDPNVFSSVLFLGDCDSLTPTCFEYWLSHSDVTEANFDEYHDVKVIVGSELFNSMMPGAGTNVGGYNYEGIAARLYQKHIDICNPDGQSISEFADLQSL